MGYKSTLAITRDDCLTEIKNRLDGASDDILASVLEELTPNLSYNYCIIPKYDDGIAVIHRYDRTPLGDES